VFEPSLAANNQNDRVHWQQRGHEYAEMAIAIDAETGKGADPPASKWGNDSPNFSIVSTR
jgi:hypothetical protein